MFAALDLACPSAGRAAAHLAGGDRVAPRLRGNIVSFQQALFNLAAVPILVVVGLLADRLGIPSALLAVAVIVLLASRLHTRALSRLREVLEE